MAIARENPPIGGKRTNTNIGKHGTAQELLAKAQAGDELAMNRLLTLIQTQHMPKRIKHYYGRNVLIEQADIESEFLLGCYEAIKIAKMDVGNPLMFILWKGQLAVAHIFRRKLKEGVQVNCKTCGIRPLTYINRELVCNKCGSNDVTSRMVIIDESQKSDDMKNGTARFDVLGDPFREMDAIFALATEDMAIEEIRKKLRGRQLELFNILIVEQINRDTSDNYLAEIAKRWGVSTACVSVYLRKLRFAVLNHFSDGDYDEQASH